METEKVAGIHGCCPNPLLILLEHPNQQPISKIKSTTAACRHIFAATTTSSFFPNTHFTNHESLPSYQESFAQFLKAYPKYSETRQVDKIRNQEYYHLSVSNHVCLDYIGIGLFSYSQVQSQVTALVPVTSSSTPSSHEWSDYPFFDISCKSVNLKSELLHGGHGSQLESSIKKKIMNFLNISPNEYSLVFTANRSSAFKLIAESYPFKTSQKLLTAYDHESEALETMVNTSEKRGANIMSAEFKWPRLRINSAKLRKLIIRKNKKKKKSRGLFVFPLQSRVTGASYSYQWMSLAQENGWHVLLDACALGPKDMDSFGLSLIHPDFLICSFYKVFGENPTGFGCLLVKKSVVSVLEASVSTGNVSLIPPTQLLNSLDSSGSGTELEQKTNFVTKLDELHISGSYSAHNGKSENNLNSTKEGGVAPKEKSKEESDQSISTLGNNTKLEEKGSVEIQCRCLDHVDSLGLMQIGSRRRYLVNWLISGLLKLQHPNRLDHFPLVKIYGPKIKFDRGTAMAFNLFDWKGERVEPILIQKLADRNNISLSHGFLSHLWFPDKYEEEKQRTIERKKGDENDAESKKSKKTDLRISVVTIALGFLANFEDVYRLWTFIAQFLDADFVEKERWRYSSLYQKTIEV
ncbi:putative peroxidase 66 [Capsicum annuum]|uniref:molybdenum cofactor sulfurase n=1 Tax=Capsicum annuum TaxID=4072 RepID=UPI001FB08858|nr:molybdenum cofactor sulfurase [Capsicum annuum]KAF3637050.1 putative peroxidase 66 [Capsicum annuum]KAF3669881.1 putative peroxidase 66 [Capsicum annuum]